MRLASSTLVDETALVDVSSGETALVDVLLNKFRGEMLEQQHAAAFLTAHATVPQHCAAAGGALAGCAAAHLVQPRRCAHLRVVELSGFPVSRDT